MVFNIGKTLDKEFKTWKGKKMTKHTQGPWEVSFSQINAGKHECIVQFGFNIRENPKAYANARLIAAAPELLEALELCLEAIQPHYDSDDDGSMEAAASNAALAAINKAKGE